jgi:3-oxoacyl-[acyl-carrier-protein] synthase II
VITGIGVVAPNGVGREPFTAALLAGRSGISELDTIDTGRLKSWAAGQVRSLDVASVLDPVELRRVPRMVPLAVAAAREALAQADFSPAVDDLATRRSIGVSLGTGGGGLAFVEDQYRKIFAGESPSPFGITAGTHGNLSSELSIQLGLRGPSHVLSTGCTSSTDALGYAALQIRAGVTPMMLAGGADAPIAPGILAGFERMRVVSTRRWAEAEQACRPFSADRDGFILGEGSWMFVLEDAEHAERRGAVPLAEIAGYASTCDAYHRVQIAPDVAEPVRAVELALADAGITPAELDYVNLHGTGTELNDRMETLAMHRALGADARRLPMSTTKSMIGHPQGACGAAGLAATILCARAGFVHPTLNVEQPDPACDLDYVARSARPAKVRLALCNCIAFGSKNSAMVVRVHLPAGST